MKVAVVIPCFRVREKILGVIQKIGPEVAQIFAVDDCCPEKTGEFLKANCKDPRLEVLVHEHNLGVGGAMVSGFRQALKCGADIIVKIDGDGQMDPSLIPRFISPIQEGLADYTKGNRFFDLRSLIGMPRIRLFGNAVLSFLTKATTGYWNIMDPTNGYLAVHRTSLELIPLDKVSRDYFFETDLLFRLNTIRAVVRDVPMNAHYADEKSSLRIGKIITQFPPRFLNRLVKRIFYNYILRDFNVASIEFLIGAPAFIFGVVFGISHWWSASLSSELASSGTVMTASLPIILGSQLLLSAVNYDIFSVPKNPLQKQVS